MKEGLERNLARAGLSFALMVLVTGFMAMNRTPIL